MLNILTISAVLRPLPFLPFLGVRQYAFIIGISVCIIVFYRRLKPFSKLNFAFNSVLCVHICMTRASGFLRLIARFCSIWIYRASAAGYMMISALKTALKEISNTQFIMPFLLSICLYFMSCAAF